MTVEALVRYMTDDALVMNLNRVNADLDEWAAEGYDVESPAFGRELSVRDALREEFRRRTGEVI